MISFDEFNAVSLDDRQTAIKEKGEFVLKKEFDDHAIELYTYNGYFVECVYSNSLGILKNINAIEVLLAAEKYISLEDKLDEYL